jgi:hypothetical protein
MSIRITLALIATAAAVAACSESPTTPSLSVPDVSALLAEMNPSSVTTAVDFAGAPVGGVFNRLAAADPSKCTYSASSGWFVCQPMTVNGLTFATRYRLIDAAGNSQSKPDAQTSALETQTSLSGSLTGNAAGSTEPTSSYTINSSSDQTLSGIRSDKHTLNGTSLTTIKGTAQIGTTTLAIDDAVHETTTDLVLPNPKLGQKWPQSGTITIESSSSNPGDPSLTSDSRAVITFNGTSVVKMTLTSGPDTITWCFDLTSPSPTPASCSQSG